MLPIMWHFLLVEAKGSRLFKGRGKAKLEGLVNRLVEAKKSEWQVEGPKVSSPGG